MKIPKPKRWCGVFIITNFWHSNNRQIAAEKKNNVQESTSKNNSRRYARAEQLE